MSVKDISDDLTTDSVPEPPRENTSVEPPRENDHCKNDMKENRNEKKMKENKEKSSKQSKPKKTPPRKPDGFQLPQPCAGSTINITAANAVQIGNVFHFNIATATQSSKPDMEKKEKFVEKPRVVKQLIKSNDIATEDDLDIAASHVGRGWENLGKKLGFTDGQLEQIEENCKRDNSDFKEMVYRMLLDWKQYKDNKATVGTLCQSLWKTHQYDAAVHLAKERSSK